MFIKDPCGITCIIITYAAVFYADYVVIKWIVLHTMEGSLWGTLNAVAFNLIIFLLTMSHFKAVISDPGTVPLPQNRLDFSDMHSAESGLDLDWTICTRCETYRPPRAHHCRICKRCIRRMDHHCPWINNCVGERNQKYFIQFLVYVGVLSSFALTLAGYSLSIFFFCADCPSYEKQKDFGRMIAHGLLLIISSIYLMFSVAILTDQLHGICADRTVIERLAKSGPFRPETTKKSRMEDVCGNQPKICWICPCSSPPPDKLRGFVNRPAPHQRPEVV
ncbi:palmitoyltransferase ZDHHC3 isoform X1 [Onthophagus taurus]|uniref:palmitoyltransferase ZDHHC3 isoform X1 n=1 Tax=Onthophagus taurus TaxID=166361 RepID=UPI000C20967B|nr:palmitoyltransferase ZDHHC3 isoform X1 [Onthophagus taurus]